MNPERLQQIDGIFQSAIDLPPERRREFLDEACANDPELRSEIESLISSLEVSGDFIEGSAADVAASLLEGESLSGKQVAQFQVGELLGRGGMGEVYSATDKMGRQVALKVLASRLVQDQQHVTRFLQEARAVLALNHPNIVTVYDIGEADGIYYIASELIEGETLRAALSGGGLDLARAVDIAIQVLHGARRRARQGHRAPGHQAGKRDAARRWLRQGARLRGGEADRAVWRFGSCGRSCRREPGDGRGPHPGNDAVHVAGAGARHARGCTHRRVELRRTPVRDAERQEPILRRRNRGYPRQDPGARADAPRKPGRWPA